MLTISPASLSRVAWLACHWLQEFFPADNESKSYALALEDIAATEGRKENHAVVNGRGVYGEETASDNPERHR